MENRPKILLIYAGGTIGMAHNGATGALTALAFEALGEYLPELNQLDVDLVCQQTSQPMDSANAGPEQWSELAEIIGSAYLDYDGFVVLHGTDTMAYAASALSFLFANLAKPVVFTGSLLPVGMLRTDGKENILTAIEIAATKAIPEVCIYFDATLTRANRTIKYSAEAFEAFKSPNCLPLIQAGVHLKVNQATLLPQPSGEFVYQTALSEKVGSIKLFPGLPLSVVASTLNNDDLDIIVIETYGTGNAPNNPALIQLIQQAIANGKMLVNVTQCKAGRVDQSLYETGEKLLAAGVIGGQDMTFEAAVTKCMVLRAAIDDPTLLGLMISTNLRGEMSN